MDYIIRGTAAGGQIRVFAATTKHMVDRAREIHNTTPVVTAALGRMMTAASMMGIMLKGEKDLLTLQIKGAGPIGGIVVTTDSNANVKGYPYNSQVDLPLNQLGKLDVSTAIGAGFLTIIKDIGLKKPYIGQTHLVSGEIAEDLTYYYANSEQIPSIVALGVLVDRDYSVKQSGGFIVQLMPEAEESLIDKLESELKKISSVTELLEKGDSPEKILEELLSGLDLKIHDKVETNYKCNCDKERVEKALISIGKKDLQELIDDGEEIELNCQFCDEKYKFTIKELTTMLENA